MKMIKTQDEFIAAVGAQLRKHYRWPPHAIVATTPGYLKFYLPMWQRGELDAARAAELIHQRLGHKLDILG